MILAILLTLNLTALVIVIAVLLYLVTTVRNTVDGFQDSIDDSHQQEMRDILTIQGLRRELADAHANIEMLLSEIPAPERTTNA